MHILFLTDNFPPEVNAPASRTFEHCREWVKAGHQVTVITCAPNFPKGKVYPGYRNAFRSRERMEGVEVIRVWSYMTANEGFLRRSIDYASFMVSATLAAPSVKGVDVIVATSPQFFTVCAGRLVSMILRKPFVFELRDLWPESIRAVGAVRDGPLIRALEAIEEHLYAKAAAIVSVTHAFKDTLVRRGVDAGKVHVVTNGADLSRFSVRPRDEALAADLGFEGKFVVGYVGTHGMAHALDTVLEAADRLRHREDVGFLFLGDGASKGALKARAQAMGLASVRFVDSVPKEDVPRYWSLLDASVIHLRRTELFTTVIPSKLFECMAMGIPVLHGVAGESAEIVRREGCGEVFEPENAEALADGIVALLDGPERRAALAACGPRAARRYDRTALAADMLRVLEDVAGVRRDGQPAKAA
ncbi:glycosyltransferase family 4 protein [Phenylobacterium sp.]|uniref:glycosyltransferase family 4 protein n=1 Tax=Phenylobacterium sp. TaxID=1871053 RepID=UPI002FE009F1